MPCNPNSSGGIKVDVNIAHRDINELHKNLGWYIALAIAMMILGVFAIFAPYAATFAVERLAGIAFAVGESFWLYMRLDGEYPKDSFSHSFSD